MDTASQPLVSIVTPVYNDAAFLAECIESVMAQTYQNWDYTIVNNCSTDGSAEIARRYAAKDPRIKVYDNQEFLHALPNHNCALRQISPQSKYCKIVFSDDWIFPQCIAQMVELAEAHPSIGIVGAYGLQGHEVLWSGLPYPCALISGREVCRRLFLDGLYVFGTATSLLYRSDLVRSHDPFYNEANVHADMEVCLALLDACDFGFVHQLLTFKRVWRGSISTFSDDIYTLMAGNLQGLVTYGPKFLNSAEFTACMDAYLSAYYNFLSVSLLRGRRVHEFWEYHKQRLKEAGVEFSRIRLARATLRRISRALLNPYETLEKLCKDRDPHSSEAESETIKARRLLFHASETQKAADNCR
jgi:glycosyltransferase involved in cell wall biosynthesis